MEYKCRAEGCGFVAHSPRELMNHKKELHGAVFGPKPKGAKAPAKPEGKKAKRKYNKRPPAMPVVSFCPCCGTNLKAVTMAIQMKGLRHAG